LEEGRTTEEEGTGKRKASANWEKPTGKSHLSSRGQGRAQDAKGPRGKGEEQKGKKPPKAIEKKARGFDGSEQGRRNIPFHLPLVPSFACSIHPSIVVRAAKTRQIHLLKLAHIHSFLGREFPRMCIQEH
jgi:hypothetical protein